MKLTKLLINNGADYLPLINELIKNAEQYSNSTLKIIMRYIKNYETYIIRSIS